jgi:protein TonB
MPAPPRIAAAPPPPAPPPPRQATRASPRGVSDGTPEARPLAHGAGSPPAGGAAPSDDPPLITAPRFRHPPRPPEYPRRAVELDLTGTVIVRALLDPSGDPREARIQRSSGHPILDGAALAAVRGWAFQPASRNGQRIPAWVEVPVHFRLH